MRTMMSTSRLAALSMILLFGMVVTTSAVQTPVGFDVTDLSRLTAAACTVCEPNEPNPAEGATDVPVDTQLSWKVPQPEGCDRFRILASTGGIGGNLHPFSLVELATDPVKEVPIGPAYSIGFVASLDFSPEGILYGADGEFRIIDPENGSVRRICGTLGTPGGMPVSLTGIAFHPDGTLYGIEWDMDRDENVFYVIDLGKCMATEVCRISSSAGSAWGIDFSPDGVLYGAFGELVKFDLAKCTASIVGRRFSLPFVNDIDCAPDGFIYGVDNMDQMLYKIDPLTGLVVQQYGPYDSELWGVASECLVKSGSARTAGASIQALAAVSTAGLPAPQEPGGLLLAAEHELAAITERGLMLDRLALRDGRIAAEDGQTRFTADDEASPILHAAAQQGSGGITCDVYLDTVNPPVKLVCRNVLPPTVGEVWTCDPGILRPDMTYYWTVVAKNACGATKAGGVWSFKTKGPIFKDTFPSATIDPAKWLVVKGATVDEKGLNEPSPPYSLRLNAYPSGGDSVESGVIDLSGYSTVTLSYCYQQGGGGDSPEETDDLIVEYYDCDRWVELGRRLGKDPETSSFERVTLELPAAALTSCFKLRFRSVGTAPNGGLFVNDDWFVDDVTLYSN